MLERRCSGDGIRPDLVVGTSVGAVNGAFLAADPTPGAVGRLGRGVGPGVGVRGVRRLAARPSRSASGGWPATCTRATRWRACSPEELGGDAVRGPGGAVPVRGGPDRDRVGAVVLGGERRGRRARVVRGARVAARAGDRRNALPRRRSGPLDPGVAGDRPRRADGLRPAGRPDRARSARAAMAVGGRTGGVRNRQAVPVQRGPRAGARGRRGARAALRLGAIAVDDDELPRSPAGVGADRGGQRRHADYLAGLESEAPR